MNFPFRLAQTWIRSLGLEDPLEKEKATHSSIWPREFHELYSQWGHRESDTMSDFHFPYPYSLNLFFIC